MDNRDMRKKRVMNAKFDPVINIKVIGVGGGGGNAVERMLNDGIRGVEFIAANTDLQQLQRQNVKTLLLGENVTAGLGAGGLPETGEAAAVDSIDKIREALSGAHMVFITAGLGGGTGTGAAPVIAKVAKEEIGALTIAVVTLPFEFEQQKRNQNALEGLTALQRECDGVVIVSNQRLYEVLGDLPTNEAFDEADKVLRQFVQSVSDIITSSALVNIDFADIKNVLEDAGIVLFGIGMEAIVDIEEDVDLLVQKTLQNPLLLSDITNAGGVILNVTAGSEIPISTHQVISNRVKDIIIKDENSITHFYWGYNSNDHLAPNEVILTIIGSKYNQEIDLGDGSGHTIKAQIDRRKINDEEDDYDETEETIGTVRSGYRESTRIYDEEEIFGTTTIQRRPHSSSKTFSSHRGRRKNKTSSFKKSLFPFRSRRRGLSSSTTGSYIRRKK